MDEMGALGGPEDELGGEELGGEELGGEDLGGGEEEPAGDDSMLLASPAKRDDSQDSMKVKSKKHGTTTTSKSNSSKDPNVNGICPKQTILEEMAHVVEATIVTGQKRLASSSDRNIWKSPGLKSLARGIYENQEPNYKDEEEREVLRLNFEVKKLIKDNGV